MEFRPPRAPPRSAPPPAPKRAAGNRPRPPSPAPSRAAPPPRSPPSAPPRAARPAPPKPPASRPPAIAVSAARSPLRAFSAANASSCFAARSCSRSASATPLAASMRRMPAAIAPSDKILKYPMLPRVLHMRPAAQLAREIADRHHPHRLAILVAEELQDRRIALHLRVGPLVPRHRRVRRDPLVHQRLHLRHLRRRHRRAMREIKPQPVRPHIRTLLRNRRAQAPSAAPNSARACRNDELRSAPAAASSTRKTTRVTRLAPFTGLTSCDENKPSPTST